MEESKASAEVKTEYDDGIRVVVADASHEKYVDIILATIADSARKRGSGIASRTHEYLATKMKERKAVIALAGEGDDEEFAGFCYIESWGNKSYVANSGPVTFAELTDDEAYWKGCGTPEHPCCINYDILQRTGRKYCVCTAMLYDPAMHPDEKLPVELPPDVVKMAKEAAEKNLR